jgi:FkbM family methyltransferase
LWVPQSDARVFERYAEFEGLPDLDVSKVAKCVALSRRRGTALDIGAHVGAVSIYLSRKFQRVVALEAVPATFEFLRRNTAGIENISPLNIAAGPADGEVYLSHYPRHGQLSHVASDADVPKTERVGPIPARAIDSLQLPDLSFIKIDVEGYELPVLQGARRTLEQFRPLVLVEQNGNEELHFGRPRDEASTFLENLGMRRHPEAPLMSKDRLYTF